MPLGLVRVTRGVLAVVTLLFSSAGVLLAQGTTAIRGRVIEASTNRPVGDVQVSLEGTTLGAISNGSGAFVISNVAPGTYQIVARRIGYARKAQSVTVAAGQAISVELSISQAASQLDAVVVTALGQTAQARTLGAAQQTVQGAAIAETQRTNFVNALQGRVAGVEVTSSSGVPGASSQITIRGVSSLSSSSQPLFIVDGLPVDNKTLHTGVLASATSTATSFENRGVDFSNRVSDINPEDIESMTVLKGPAAAALYGIDAANGAIVITTKRGKAGTSAFEYSNSFSVQTLRERPEIQKVYGQSTVGSTTLLYWGDPYAPGTTLYDNIGGFFRTATSQKHNLTFSGASPNGINYRLSGGLSDDNGVVPNSRYQRWNLSGGSGAQVKPWLAVDLGMIYAYSDNDQPFKGTGGPLIGLLVWPQVDNAADYLTPAGTRRRISSLAASSEVDNPFFNVDKNNTNQRNTRFNSNLRLTLSPFSWGSLRTNIGADTYTNQTQILRHPESQWGFASNGILDVANDVTRNFNAQTVLSINTIGLTKDFSISGMVGNAVTALKSQTDALMGTDFIEPNFVSVNNANLRSNRTTISQRRLVGLFGEATLDFRKFWYVKATGRNDWTSTIPAERNSFFYPSVSTSLILSDAVPALAKVMTARLRGSWAQSGRDAPPYAYKSALEYKTTAYGGYGFGFTGPNPGLRPEFKTEVELGADLSFLNDRLAIEPTVYRNETKDQIITGVRGSYGTGFVLLNLNGGVTRNEGLEMVVRGTPIMRPTFSWDVSANFDKSHGKVISIPRDLPEYYNSDTWLYGNVRNSTAKGMSTRSLMGTFYLRNKNGDILVDPATGLPIRNSTFVDGGYDRQPDFTLGLENRFAYKKLSMSALLDFRKGGDVLNATEHFLTQRGLSMRTLDRDQPRVVKGVLRDGKENTANPTVNNIVVIPSQNTNYYLTMSEELFIEKDINWMRLRDVTVRYALPPRFGRNASVFVTGTDLFLLTNYTGLDPIVNGNTAAVGGSGSAGIDYGNFPIPRGINFGIKTGF